MNEVQVDQLMQVLVVKSITGSLIKMKIANKFKPNRT